MPARYSLTAPAATLHKRLGVEIPEMYMPRYNAAPSQLLPVITHEDPGGLSFFYWGSPPKWSRNKTLSRKLINADLEDLREKPTYRKALASHRCLVPADGFYGWKLVGKKSRIPHRIILNQSEIFCMAGLWEEYQDEEDETVHTFSIITTPANALVEPLDTHMPAILDRGNEVKWLDTDCEVEDLLNMLQPYPSHRMGLYTISHLINSQQLDTPSLIQPAPAVDQHGNYTLFN